MYEPSSRQLAQSVLESVDRDDAYSHLALDAALKRCRLDGRDRRLATQLVYGTLTWQRALDVVLDDFVNRGVDGLDLPVVVALRMAAYQLIFLDRIPSHAAVDEAVEIVKHGPSRAASGLVNGVLRNIVRHGDDSIQWWRDEDRQARPARYLGRRYSLPDWIARRILRRRGLGQKGAASPPAQRPALQDEPSAETLAAAFNDSPPVYLRLVDRQLTEWPDGVEPIGALPSALRAESIDSAVREGLKTGKWVVQDLGSQIVGGFSGVRPGQTVLDACAGLGGKALDLAARVGPDGHVVAVDPAASKIELLHDAAHTSQLAGRVSTHTETLARFARQTDQTFDAVLVDAPCSGLGVLRRHPETRWRRSESDIADLVDLQESLLEVAAGLVRPGGVLTYAVCTFACEEGPTQIARFLDRHGEFSAASPPETDLDWSRYVDDDNQLSLSPDRHDTDAFFAARLVKHARG